MGRQENRYIGPHPAEVVNREGSLKKLLADLTKQSPEKRSAAIDTLNNILAETNWRPSYVRMHTIGDIWDAPRPTATSGNDLAEYHKLALLFHPNDGGYVSLGRLGDQTNGMIHEQRLGGLIPRSLHFRIIGWLDLGETLEALLKRKGVNQYGSVSLHDGEAQIVYRGESETILPPKNKIHNEPYIDIPLTESSWTRFPPANEKPFYQVEHERKTFMRNLSLQHDWRMALIPHMAVLN